MRRVILSAAKDLGRDDRPSSTRSFASLRMTIAYSFFSSSFHRTHASLRAFLFPS